MLLESMIDHEYPLAMKMEAEAPMVATACAVCLHGDELNVKMPLRCAKAWACAVNV